MGMPAFEAPAQTQKSPIERLIEGGADQIAGELKVLLSRMKAGEITPVQLREQMGLSLEALIHTVEVGQ